MEGLVVFFRRREGRGARRSRDNIMYDFMICIDIQKVDGYCTNGAVVHLSYAIIYFHLFCDFWDFFLDNYRKRSRSPLTFLFL